MTSKSKIARGKIFNGKLYFRKSFCRDHDIKNGSRVVVRLLEVLPPGGEEVKE